jgi:hypothetical protein
MIREFGAVHDVCNLALYVIDENGAWSYFTVDWQPITSGMCPRCGRRLVRRRLRLLSRPTVRGTGARR